MISVTSVSHKLHSQRGVSILYALLFFLVAFMVSAVVIAASTSSIKSVHNDEAWKQESLELESAGKLVKTLLCNVTLVATTDSEGNVSISAKDAADPLAAKMATVYAELLTGTAAAEKSWAMSIAPNNERFRDVTVTFTMHSPSYVNGKGAEDPSLIEADITLANESEGIQHLYLYAHLPDPGSQTEFSWSSETATLTTVKDA